MAAGKFVIKKARGGEFRFSVVGRSGQIVATSETYIPKASCIKGTKAVKTLVADAEVDDRTRKEWITQQADVKAKAATRRATKIGETRQEDDLRSRTCEEGGQDGEDDREAGCRLVRPQGTAN